MSQFSLSPAARPVDMFGPAEVRADLGAGDDVTQLASALSRLSPELTQFGSDYLANKRNAAALEAEEDFRKMQLKSMKDFNAAVESGQIDAESNPWKASFMRQLVRREEFSKLTTGVLQEYETDPIRNVDDVAQLDAWFASKVDPFMKDLRPDEMRAVGESFDRFRSQFASQHIERRANERAAMSRQNLSAEFGNAINSNENIVGQINDLMAAARLHGHAESELFELLTSSLSSSTAVDADEAAQLMEGVQIDGKSFRAFVGDETASRIQDRLADNITRKNDEEIARAEKKEEQNFKEANRVASAIMLDARRQGTTVDTDKLFVSLSKYSPDIQLRFFAVAQAMNKDIEAEHVGEILGIAYESIARGGSPEDARITAETGLLLAGRGEDIGATSARIQEYSNMLRRAQEVQESDPSLFAAALDQTRLLDGGAMADLLASSRFAGKLTESDVHTLIAQAADRSSRDKYVLRNEYSDAAERVVVKQLEPLFRAADFEFDADGNPITELSPEYYEAVKAVNFAFLDLKADLSKEDALSPDQIKQRVNDLADTLRMQYGLVAGDGKPDTTATVNTAAATVVPTLINNRGVIEKPAGPQGGITFEKGRGMVAYSEPGGPASPVTTPVRLFSSLKDLKKNGWTKLNEMARAAGKPPDTREFVKQVRREMVDENPDELIDALRRALLSPAAYEEMMDRRDEEAREAYKTLRNVSDWLQVHANRGKAHDALIKLLGPDGTYSPEVRVPSGVSLDEFITSYNAHGYRVTWGHIGYRVEIPTTKALEAARAEASKVTQKFKDEDNRLFEGLYTGKE